ncbi:792_t:CDS:1 [Funneliformis caledonium]|uniref:792_t:CDS:1 n=1 Tax=Funneliformis caledonium TaxID=1117310 RepID=A0A9N9B7U0_9GLOM|nr:792_t:CDS:1 [Funneliformis caledonium]
MDIDVRYKQHSNGRGSVWTRRYRPTGIKELVKTKNKHLELMKTLEYINRYGINNVRGKPYCKEDISEFLGKIRYQLSQQCYLCGRYGHVANKCICDICCSRDHLTEQCNNCPECGGLDHVATECYNCFKCGRRHSSENCNRCYICGERDHLQYECE